MRRRVERRAVRHAGDRVGLDDVDPVATPDLARVGAHAVGDPSRPLVVPQAVGTGVVGHQRIVTVVEPRLEPLHVADGEADVDDRIFGRSAVLGADVRFTSGNPGESTGLELHQTIGAAVARDRQPKTALDRDQAQDEEGVEPRPPRFTDDGLGELASERRIQGSRDLG